MNRLLSCAESDGALRGGVALMMNVSWEWIFSEGAAWGKFEEGRMGDGEVVGFLVFFVRFWHGLALRCLFWEDLDMRCICCRRHFPDIWYTLLSIFT